MFSLSASSFCRAYKTLQEDDLKFPLVFGEGKKVRGLLMTKDRSNNKGIL